MIMAVDLGLGPVNAANGTTTAAGGGFDWGALFGDVAKGVVNSGGQLFTNSLKSDANDEAALAYAKSTAKGVDTLNRGYDEQLSAIEQGTDTLQGINQESYNQANAVLDKGNQGYEELMLSLPQEYSQSVLPRYAQNANETLDAVDAYSGDMLGVEDDLTSLIQQSKGEFSDQYDPYIQSGARASQYLDSILGMDPSQKTLSQQRSYDQALADMKANLAASNLRGAGRAGVASINEGVAEMNARTEDENRRRMDAVASNLAQTGYNATGSVANNAVRASEAMQNNRNRIGTNLAETGLKTATTLSDRQLDVDNELARLSLDTKQKVGANNLVAAKDKSGNLSTFYANKAANEAPRYDARGKAAVGKAAVTASGQGAIDRVNMEATKANADGKNAAIDSLYSSLNEAVKKNVFKDKL
jgi:hypothetical protein